MGAVMICRDEPVKTPYYIESMGIRLYSMEDRTAFYRDGCNAQTKGF